jgi:hypothetical protein
MTLILGVKTNIMSFLSDLKEYPVWVKSMVVSIICFIPFWFAILYYFFPLILAVGWYEKLLFILVPASIWYVMEVAIHKLVTPILESHFEEKLSEKEFWFLVLVDAFIYLLPVFLVAYYLKFTFEQFCWVAFGYRFVSLIYVAFAFITFTKKQKK